MMGWLACKLKTNLHRLVPTQVVDPRPNAPKQVLDALVADKALGAKLSAPSVSYGAQNLYMCGPLEEATRGNLARVRAPSPFRFLSSLGRAAC